MTNYVLATDEILAAAVADCCASDVPYIGFDTETTGLARWRDTVVGWSFAPYPGLAYYVPVDHDERSVDPAHGREQLANLLAAKPVVCHGAAFDTVMAARYLGNGWNPYDIDVAYCTLILAHVIGERSEGGKDTSAALKSLASKYLGVKRATFDDLFPPKTKKKDKNFRKVDLDIATPYAAADADDVLGLVQVLLPMVERLQVESTYALEVTGRTPAPWPHHGQGNVLHEILWMESRGVVIDAEYAASAAAECRRFASEIEAAVKQRLAFRLGRELPVEFNLNSGPQLQEILFEPAPTGLGLPVLKRTPPSTRFPEGNRSVDEDVLKRLSVHEPALSWLLELRAAEKAAGTYFEPMPAEHAIEEDGMLVVHPNIKQTGTETGRTASDGPNMQNQPKDQAIGVWPDGVYRGQPMVPELGSIKVNARDMVVPRPGFYFVEMDWSQVEYRAIGGLSGDPGLLDVFDRGIDLHVSTYALMNGVPLESVSKEMRAEGKTMNYALNFGAGKNRVAGMLGTTPQDAEQKIQRWKQAFPLVALWKDQTEEFAKRYRYVQTLFGRKRWLIFGGEGVVGSTERKAYYAALREAVNMPVQGVCADLLKIMLVRLGPWLRANYEGVRTVLTVHDSVLFEVPETIEANAFIDAVRPVVEFPRGFLPGWPAITADFSVGYRWGSLHEVGKDSPLLAEPVLAPSFDAPRAVELKLFDCNPGQATALSALIPQLPGTNELWITMSDQIIKVPNVGIEPSDVHFFAHIFERFELVDRGLLGVGTA